MHLLANALACALTPTGQRSLWEREIETCICGKVMFFGLDLYLYFTGDHVCCICFHKRVSHQSVHMVVRPFI